VAGSCNAG